MSKKSLFYIGAGVLLILAAVLSLVEGALTYHLNAFTSSTGEGWGIVARLPEGFSFKWLSMYMRDGMNFLSWVNLILLVAAGVVLLVKAFMPDLVPNIVLGGIFGLLAVLTLIALFRNFINLFHAGGFRGVLRVLVYILMNVLTVAAFGGMAAIVILKDSFGSFFFVPAFAAAGNAVIAFLMNVTGLFGGLQWTFGASLVFFLIDCVLIAALFAAGMANNEE